MNCHGCTGFHTRKNSKLEENFLTLVLLIAADDYLSVRQPMILPQGRRRYNNGHFFLEVPGNIPKLLDVTHTLQLSHSGEAESALVQDLHEVVS